MEDGSKKLTRDASTTSRGDGDHSDSDSDEPCKKKAMLSDRELRHSSIKRRALPDQASRWAIYKGFNSNTDDASWSLFGLTVVPFDNLFSFETSKCHHVTM